jgi:membrane protease YdiL (CAAX protease family)
LVVAFLVIMFQIIRHYASMLIPAVSVLATNAVARGEQPPIDWGRLPLEYVPVALLLMPLVMHAAMLPTAAALDGLHWQGWLMAEPDGLYHAPPERGWGVLTPAGLAGRIALNAIAGGIVVSILALFEEIGWRGWLLTRLIGRTSRRRAVVICSIIWAIWHTPYVWAGILHLEGVPPAWTAIVTPVGIFGSGPVIGWLWLRTKSIWIAAVAHGALNNWGQYAFKFVSGEGRPSDGLVLAAGGVALIAVGAILLVRET